MSGPEFEITATDGAARTGRLLTAHGPVATPAFMPVGTAATVKAMTPQMLADSGADMVLANTYHLILRPGVERMAALGGLRRFMAWPGPVLTDSGGFQVMSLAALRRLDEDGVTFRSHLDGSKHRLTPESSVAAQGAFGVTVTMVLDECTPFPAEKSTAAESMALSLRWAVRSKAAFSPRPGYGLFGIVQGSVFGDLRQESAARLADCGFDGYAIGGLAVGEGPAAMIDMAALTAEALPKDRPRYLMGVGRPEDIVAAVAAGVDMFDCVLPTRSGRNGQAFTAAGKLNIRNARHADAAEPLDPECGCPTCLSHSRAYLHHLVRSGEILGAVLMTQHNLHYYQGLMAQLRAAVLAGRLCAFVREFTARSGAGLVDPEPPAP